MSDEEQTAGLTIHGLAAQYVSGMMSVERLRALGDMLVLFDWRRYPGAIAVEIGTYHGETSAFMAKCLQLAGHPDVPVVAVDPFERSGPVDAYNARGEFYRYIETIQAHDVERQCFPVATFSRQAARLFPAEIGVLVIDGNHTYEDCKAELDLYVPKVMHGGFIFIDDDVEEFYPGTVQAITDYFETLPGYNLMRHGGFATARRP